MCNQFLDRFRNIVYLLKLPFFASLSTSFLISSCAPPNPAKISQYQSIDGRKFTGLYEIIVPSGFELVPLHPNRSFDTKEAIAQYILKTPEGNLNLVIHNFSIPIPPMAQVERWKKQIPQLIDTETFVTQQAFSGFSGLCFKGSNVNISMFAWAMTLSPDLQRILGRLDCVGKEEAGCNITIKATGPKELMHQYENDIDNMARSFQLSFGIPKYP